MSDWMRKMLMGVALGAVFALGVSLFGGVGSRDAVIQAQETGVVEEPQVSEKELDLYIEVYRAMQADRTLKIGEALEDRGVSLAEFRSIERKVQYQERLVKRVREALLEQAKESSTSLVERGVAARAEDSPGSAQ